MLVSKHTYCWVCVSNSKKKKISCQIFYDGYVNLAFEFWETGSNYSTIVKGKSIGSDIVIRQ